MKTPTTHTDTERLDYLLRFIDVDDVGDDHSAPGIVVNWEAMEEAVGLGKYDPNLFSPGRGGNPCLCAFGDDMRTVIDRAIDEHGSSNPWQVQGFSFPSEPDSQNS